ncbi:AmmeMemoRadiSam system protein B [Labilibacter sediminis]|nr:AmmeMemoRadiSam system protein B [Labilibacter sediminis]
MLSIEREPVVAGTFYSSSPKKLIDQLKDCFADCPKLVNNHISALVVPHAGYVYSGKVAASAYAMINRNAEYDNVFIIGSSHHVSFNGASVYNKGHYKTPLGVVPVNLKIANDLINHSQNMVFNDSAHSEEHTIEVQLPFLQFQLKNLRHIVPIVIGVKNNEACNKIAESLRPYFNSKNLFIFSTDLSHYPSDEDARMVDENTVKAICSNKVDDFIKAIKENEEKKIPNLFTSICGWSSVLTLLYLTKGKKNFKYSPIKYMTSGDIVQKDKVVGYQSILIEDIPLKSSNLNYQDQKKLLKMARQAIENHLVFKNENLVQDKISVNLPFDSAFVSVYVKEKLRGCIGQFNSSMEFSELIREMAISAAYQDSRFASLLSEEFDDLRIEISVLTPMRKIKSIDEIELGKHGVYLKKDEAKGTFLPQVAVKTGWDLLEFLGHLARDKAHIGWDGWRDAEIYVFEAIIFSE